MRITKKYTGNSSIGKRTFTPLVGSPENLSFVEMSRKDLENLRQIWVNKLQIAEQWNQRKFSFVKSSGKLTIPQELLSMAVAFPTSTLLTSASAAAAAELTDENHQQMPIDFANYAKTQGEQGIALHDERIALGLQPFCNNPAELNYLMHWLKSSVHAIQHATSPQDLDQLIQIGELSLPNLFKASSSSSSSAHQQAQAPPRQNGHPRLEDLQRVIEAYFDHRNLPTDVAYRVYHDGSSGGGGGSRREGSSSSSAEKKRGGTVSKNTSPQTDSSKQQLQQREGTSSGAVKVDKEACDAAVSIPAQAHLSPMPQQGQEQAQRQSYTSSATQQQARFTSINNEQVMYMRQSYPDAANFSYWQGLMPLPSLPPPLPASVMRPSSSGSNSSGEQQQPQFMQLMGNTVKLPPRQSWLEDTLPVSTMGHGRHPHMQTHSSNTIPLDAYGMVSMMPQNRQQNNSTGNGGGQQSRGHSSKSTTPHLITSNCAERMLFAMSSEPSEHVPKPSSRSEYKYNPELVSQQQKRKTEDHHNQHHDSKKTRAAEVARQEKADNEAQLQKDTIENAAQALLGLFRG